MKYTITINDDDYLKFNIFYTYRSRGGKRSLRIVRFTMPVLGALFLLFLLVTGAEFGRVLTDAVCLTAVSVFWVLHPPKGLEKNVRRQISSLKKYGKLPYHACAEIEFQDTMIVERYEQGEFRLNYADVENLYFEDAYIYIFYTSLQAFIIPYRCLGADKERVVEFLKEKCEKGEKP